MYFMVDDIEKKWDTVNPADLKRLFVTGAYTLISRWSRNVKEEDFCQLKHRVCRLYIHLPLKV
jgi:hypothetical protein